MATRVPWSAAPEERGLAAVKPSRWGPPERAEQLLARGVLPSQVVAVVCQLSEATMAERGVCRCARRTIPAPRHWGPALAGVERLLLVSSSESGQRVAQHSNVITAARTAGVSRIACTSLLNAVRLHQPAGRRAPGH